MKNKWFCGSGEESVGAILKRLIFSKKWAVFYVVVGILVALVDASILPDFLGPQGDGFGRDFSYVIFMVLFWAGALLALSTILPVWLGRKASDEEGQPPIPAWIKMLSLWIPLAALSVVQTLIFSFCALVVADFEVLALILRVGLASVVMLLAWILLCALVYFAAGSVGWYFLGLLTIHLAPGIIGWGYCAIYNAHPLVNYLDWNFFNSNLFIVVGALCSRPLLMLIVLAVTLGGFVLVMWSPKIRDNGWILTVYKWIVIFSAALCAGCLVAARSEGLGRALLLTGVTLAVAVGLSILVFPKNKPLLHMGVPIVAAVVCAVLMVTVLPKAVEKEVYSLPDAKKIESVQWTFDSMEGYEVREDFEDCLALHATLLDLFKEGYLPEESDPYGNDSYCIAELWEDVDISYQLKNGERVWRSYRNLKDPAFDDFNIAFLKSDMYRNLLLGMDLGNLKMHYYAESNYDWERELPENIMEQLIEIYCDELQEAEESAFYEGYEKMELSVKDEYEKRTLYIPLSFEKTREFVRRF